LSAEASSIKTSAGAVLIVLIERIFVYGCCILETAKKPEKPESEFDDEIKIIQQAARPDGGKKSSLTGQAYGVVATQCHWR
jgi:hypothetical protein